MAFLIYKAISFTEVIECLCELNPGGSSVSSPLGSMLEKLRDGVYFVNRSSQNNEDYKLLSKVPVLDCIDSLRGVAKVDFENVPDVRAFCKANNLAEGPFCLSAVANYHTWASKSQQRGLVEVYRLMQRLQPSLPEPQHSEEDLAQAFRTGKEKKSRDRAARILADAELATYTWISIYNKRQQRKINRDREQ